jgi:hypothetical protein
MREKKKDLVSIVLFSIIYISWPISYEEMRIQHSIHLFPKESIPEVEFISYRNIWKFLPITLLVL